MNRKNLIQRLAFAAVAIPVGWWVINSALSLVPTAAARWIGLGANRAVFPGHVTAMALIIIAFAEYKSMLNISFRRNGFWMIYIWLIYQLTSYLIPSIALPNQLDTYLLLTLVAAEAFIWGRNTERWRRASLLFSGTLFLSVAGYSMLNFYHGSLQRIFPRIFDASMLSQMGIITILGSIFLCDTAAYFIGSLYGRHRLTRISPKKTVEGSAAGFVTAVIVSTAGWHFFADTSRFPLWQGVCMGMVIGVFAQVGDLLVSLIKRYFNVKDASKILPGHGGILDRFDSVFFTAPILNLFFMLLTRLAE